MPLGWPKRPTLQNRTHSAPDGISLRQRQPAARFLDSTAIPKIREEGSPFSPEGLEKSEPSNKLSGWTRHPHVNIAVLGASGTGKSTFIQRTLDLKLPPTSQAAAKKMSLEGNIFIVRLHEIDFSHIKLDAHGCIIWPHTLDDQILPSMNGALVLFDSSNLSSIAQHPQIFGSLTQMELPVVVVACKCDLPPSPEVAMFEQTRQLLGAVKVHRTAINDDTSHKKCVSSILSQISNRSDLVPKPFYIQGSEEYPFTNNYHTRQHIRASSETPPAISSYATEQLNFAYDLQASNLNATPPLDRPRNNSTCSHLMPPHTPSRSQFSIDSHQSISSQGSDSVTVASVSDHNNNASSETPDSGMDDCKPSGVKVTESEDVPPSTGGDAVEQGYTFDELVDRLARLPQSEADMKFACVFLCVYRKFTTPYRVLNALLDRFYQLESTDTLLMQYGLQLRLVTLITQWVKDHPGDFVNQRARKRLSQFIASIEAEYLFTYFAKEIGNVLAKPIEDYDKGWAFTDDEESVEALEKTSPAHSILQDHDDSILVGSVSNITQDSITSATDSLRLSSSSGTNAESLSQSRPTTSNDSPEPFLSVEHAQRAARALVVRPSMPMRESWRIFDSIDVDDFAHQITRMDWIMYRAFRGRDMFRHANTPQDKRDNDPGLEHINRMVDSFNDLALFVVSMILFPDKPKHRARTIEKFSKIAIKLRELNNYNSCGAIIAGFERAPVHRLTETKVLSCKSYKSVWTLMSTSRSYSTYRLAFQNTYTQKIAFLPTHLSDLFRADQGNPTFVGINKDRINWKKFDLMGSMILEVQQSQEKPSHYNRRVSKYDTINDPTNADMPKQEKKSHDIYYMDLKKCAVARDLVLKSERYAQEEDIIARSLQIEPPQGFEPQRRRFESIFGRRSRD